MLEALVEAALDSLVTNVGWSFGDARPSTRRARATLGLRRARYTGTVEVPVAVRAERVTWPYRWRTGRLRVTRDGQVSWRPGRRQPYRPLPGAATPSSATPWCGWPSVGVASDGRVVLLVMSPRTLRLLDALRDDADLGRSLRRSAVRAHRHRARRNG